MNNTCEWKWIDAQFCGGGWFDTTCGGNYSWDQSKVLTECPHCKRPFNFVKDFTREKEVKEIGWSDIKDKVISTYLDSKKCNMIIAGGRDFYPKKEHILWLKDQIKKYSPSTILCGMATGADLVGFVIAHTLGIEVKEFPADWDNKGRYAGPIRNEQMAKEANICILFPGGRGTDSMRNLVIKHEVEVVEYESILL